MRQKTDGRGYYIKPIPAGHELHGALDKVLAQPQCSKRLQGKSEAWWDLGVRTSVYVLQYLKNVAAKMAEVDYDFMVCRVCYNRQMPYSPAGEVLHRRRA